MTTEVLLDEVQKLKVYELMLLTFIVTCPRLRVSRLVGERSKEYISSSWRPRIHSEKIKCMLLKSTAKRIQILRSTETQRQPSMRVMMQWLLEFRILFKLNFGYS